MISVTLLSHVPEIAEEGGKKGFAQPKSGRIPKSEDRVPPCAEISELEVRSCLHWNPGVGSCFGGFVPDPQQSLP